MSSRQWSGAGDRAERLAAAGTAAPGLLKSVPPLLGPTVWLLALATSLGLPSAGRAQDSAARRRQRIESKTPAEKKQLNRDYQWFMGLKPAERQQLRQLHSQLEHQPELRRTLHAYCRWLKSLSAHDRTELLALDTAERIERIKQFRADEAQRPKLKDMEGLRRWVQAYTASPDNQQKIFRAMFRQARPREIGINEEMKKRREEMKGRIDEMRKKIEEMRKKPETRRFLAGMAMWGQMYRPGKPDWITDDDLAELRKNLSDETRKLLASKSADDQWETVRGWVRPPRGRPLGRRFGSDPPPKELQEFFENELSAEQKEELLNLPADEMQLRLKWRYFSRFMPMPGPGFGRWRPGPPGPPRGRPGRRGGGPRGEGPRQRGEGPRQNGRPHER